MIRRVVNFAVVLSLSLGSCIACATPLHRAAQAADLPKARALIMDDPSSVNVMDPQGFTPLSIAAERGDLEMVKLLVDKGAALEDKANYRGAPVSTVAFYADPATVRLLLVKAPVAAVGATPLYIAALEGHVAVAKLLVESGAALEAKAESGGTSLSIAAAKGHVDVVQLLLEKGAAIDSADRSGSTPLRLATQGGHLAIVKLLLEKGAAVDAKDGTGDRKTNVEIAEERGYVQIAEVLRQAQSKQTRPTTR